MLRDKFLIPQSNTVIKAGDSLVTYNVFNLTFYNNNKMNFEVKRKRFYKCSTCSDFVPYDSLTSNVTKYYYAKNTFIILADSTGWNPFYYEADYINDHTVRFDKCVEISGSNKNLTRQFNTIPIDENQNYFIDIFMQVSP